MDQNLQSELARAAADATRRLSSLGSDLYDLPSGNQGVLEKMSKVIREVYEVQVTMAKALERLGRA